MEQNLKTKNLSTLHINTPKEVIPLEPNTNKDLVNTNTSQQLDNKNDNLVKEHKGTANTNPNDKTNLVNHNGSANTDTKSAGSEGVFKIEAGPSNNPDDVTTSQKSVTSSSILISSPSETETSSETISNQSALIQGLGESMNDIIKAAESVPTVQHSYRTRSQTQAETLQAEETEIGLHSVTVVGCTSELVMKGDLEDTNYNGTLKYVINQLKKDETLTTWSQQAGAYVSTGHVTVNDEIGRPRLTQIVTTNICASQPRFPNVYGVAVTNSPGIVIDTIKESEFNIFGAGDCMNLRIAAAPITAKLPIDVRTAGNLATVMKAKLNLSDNTALYAKGLFYVIMQMRLAQQLLAHNQLMPYQEGSVTHQPLTPDPDNPFNVQEFQQAHLADKFIMIQNFDYQGNNDIHCVYWLASGGYRYMRPQIGQAVIAAHFITWPTYFFHIVADGIEDDAPDPVEPTPFQMLTFLQKFAAQRNQLTQLNKALYLAAHLVYSELVPGAVADANAAVNEAAILVWLAGIRANAAQQQQGDEQQVGVELLEHEDDDDEAAGDTDNPRDRNYPDYNAHYQCVILPTIENVRQYYLPKPSEVSVFARLLHLLPIKISDGPMENVDFGVSGDSTITTFATNANRHSLRALATIFTQVNMTMSTILYSCNLTGNDINALVAGDFVRGGRRWLNTVHLILQSDYSAEQDTLTPGMCGAWIYLEKLQGLMWKHILPDAVLAYRAWGGGTQYYGRDIHYLAEGQVFGAFFPSHSPRLGNLLTLCDILDKIPLEYGISRPGWKVDITKESFFAMGNIINQGGWRTGLGLKDLTEWIEKGVPFLLDPYAQMAINCAVARTTLEQQPVLMYQFAEQIDYLTVPNWYPVQAVGQNAEAQAFLLGWMPDIFTYEPCIFPSFYHATNHFLAPVWPDGADGQVRSIVNQKDNTLAGGLVVQSMPDPPSMAAAGLASFRMPANRYSRAARQPPSTLTSMTESEPGPSGIETSKGKQAGKG